MKAHVLSAVYRLGWNSVSAARNARRPVRCLEIGPGPDPIPGFEALNIVWTPGVDYVCNASKRLPFGDNTFDTLYASHILEHIPWYKVPDVITEWCRILKPEGSLEVWVPNGLEIARAFVAAEDGQPNAIHKDGWYKFNPNQDPAVWANGRVFSYGDGRGTPGHFNWHLALFSERYLQDILSGAGFSQTGILDRSAVRGYDHGWINLGVYGKK
ncbi:methyltransferase domain-containing protein [Phaeobacter sp. PT47_59]|nr:methyltransferase domain-containing protein [Phaeobacter sp. PT47_59]MDE4176721.1 methyltransferase domain-containing protein [Phaeobacter sp. PT47_59]